MANLNEDLSWWEWELSDEPLLTISYYAEVVACIDRKGYFHCNNRELMVKVLRKEIYDIGQLLLLFRSL
ncbi:hypothetical protein ACFLU8_02945 [Chloroflexota bacterium]